MPRRHRIALHPQVAVHDLTPVQKTNPEVRGILGQSFLAHFDLLIDQPNLLLCFDNTGRMQSALAGEHIPLLRASPSAGPSFPFTEPVLIPARMANAGRSGATVLKLDCGGNVAVLFPAAQKTPAPRTASERIPRIRQGNALGRSGTVALASTPPREVIIGKRRLRRVVFLTPAAGEIAAIRSGEDGLLPTSIFRRIFISNQEHYVIFDPD